MLHIAAGSSRHSTHTATKVSNAASYNFTSQNTILVVLSCKVFCVLPTLIFNIIYLPITKILNYSMDRDSSVGIATRYGLGGPRLESRWGERDFPLRSKDVVRPSQPATGYRISFPGVKLPGRGVDHPPPSRTEVKARVELYLRSPSGILLDVMG